MSVLPSRGAPSITNRPCAAGSRSQLAGNELNTTKHDLRQARETAGE